MHNILCSHCGMHAHNFEVVSHIAQQEETCMHIGTIRIDPHSMEIQYNIHQINMKHVGFTVLGYQPDKWGKHANLLTVVHWSFSG